MNYVKTGLDLFIQAMNYFPGYKTKAGAALQILGTILLSVSYFQPDLIPQEIVITINAAGATLTAVGAANQPANKPPSA
jgi:hypothetical protein